MTSLSGATDPRYAGLVNELSGLLESARRVSARAVNVLMTAAYWEIGRRIVEYAQNGERRASYGALLLHRLSADLITRFGRGFSERNLEQMQKFYLWWQIPQALDAETGALLEIPQTLSAKSPFPLPNEQFLADEIARSRPRLDARLASRGRLPRPRPGRSAGETLWP